MPIDSWQLWEHHKHEVDRSASRNRRSSSRCKFFLIQKPKITTENFLFFFVFQLVHAVQMIQIHHHRVRPRHLHAHHVIILVELDDDD